MTPEKAIQNNIMNYLKKLENSGHPVFINRRQAGGFSYKMGLPDLYVVYNGIHIEIEVKRQGGQLRAMQEKWKERFKALNILYLCADSVEDVKMFMKEKFNVEG